MFTTRAVQVDNLTNTNRLTVTSTTPKTLKKRINWFSYEEFEAAINAEKFDEEQIEAAVRIEMVKEFGTVIDIYDYALLARMAQRSKELKDEIRRRFEEESPCEHRSLELSLFTHIAYSKTLSLIMHRIRAIYEKVNVAMTEFKSLKYSKK